MNTRISAIRILLPVFLAAVFLWLSSCGREAATPTAPPAATTCRSCSYYDDFPAFRIPSRYGLSNYLNDDFVIKSKDEWKAFLSKLTNGTYDTEPPVDFSQKMLAVKFTSESCNNVVVPREVCTGPDRVTIRYEVDEKCCQSFVREYPGPIIIEPMPPPIYWDPGMEPMAFALDPVDLPVVWERTFVPYAGEPCPTPVIWIDPWYDRFYPTGNTVDNPSAANGEGQP